MRLEDLFWYVLGCSAIFYVFWLMLAELSK